MKSKVRAGAAIALSIALQQLFPKAIILSTRVTDIGFACDCLFVEAIDPAMLGMIERQMIAVIRSDPALIVSEMMSSNVCEYLRYHGQPERADLFNSDAILVDVVRVGDYLEVIPGPHVDSLKEVGALKLLSMESDDQPFSDDISCPITTISGCAFANKQELKQFLKLADAAAECDHRRLGRELSLYDRDLWMPKGQAMRDSLLDWWRGELRARSFEMICTPTLVDGELPETRLPLHAALYNIGLHSYRELPKRYAECAPLYQPLERHEVVGLLKQENFYGDEESVFCRPDQAVAELISSLQFIDKTIRVLGLRSKGFLYVRGPSCSGTVAQWNQGLRWLQEALKAIGLSVIDQLSPSGLRGPKVEFKLLDALEREWPGPSVGFDFALPELQGLRYQSKQDDMVAPLLIAQTTFSSLERTVALLVERYAGALPLWLSPEQVRVLPVNDEQRAYAIQVRDQCRVGGLRATVDERNERLAAKVFAAEAAKIPFIVIVGDKEAREGAVTVRTGQRRQHGDRMSVEALVALMKTSER